MRKLLSFLIVIVLVLSCTTIAYAKVNNPATPNQVRIAAQQEAKAELQRERKEQKEHRVFSKKLSLYQVKDGSSDKVDLTKPMKGHVKITAPRGYNDLLIHGVISGLTAKTTYAVWVRDLEDYSGDYLEKESSLGYFSLVTFKTDEDGHGNFQIKIADKDLPDETYELQVAINTGTSRTTVAATVKNIRVVIK